MSKHSALLAALALALAAGCGGDDRPPAATPPGTTPPPGTPPPATPPAAVTFPQYTQNLIATQTSDTATPVEVPNTTDVKDDETPIPESFFAQ